MNHQAPSLAERQSSINPIGLKEHTTEAIRERCLAHTSVTEYLNCCSSSLSDAAWILFETIESRGRVFTCGNGGSASEAQHFAAELVGRFRTERCAYPATALTADASTITAIANDYGYEHTFSRQIEGLARPGDALVAFSTSGRSANVIRAAEVSRERGVRVISVTGEAPNPLTKTADIVIAVPSSDTPTIQEFHMLFTHILCGVVESALTEDTLRRVP